MKKLLLGLLVLGSTSVFSQENNIDYSQGFDDPSYHSHIEGYDHNFTITDYPIALKLVAAYEEGSKPTICTEEILPMDITGIITASLEQPFIEDHDRETNSYDIAYSFVKSNCETCFYVSKKKKYEDQLSLKEYERQCISN